MSTDTSPRPVIDALLDACMMIIQESANINRTGKTYKVIKDEATVMLYTRLDELTQLKT